MLNKKMEDELESLGKKFYNYISNVPEDENFDFDREYNNFITKYASEELKQYIKEMEKLHAEARKQGIILD